MCLAGSPSRSPNQALLRAADPALAQGVAPVLCVAFADLWRDFLHHQPLGSVCKSPSSLYLLKARGGLRASAFLGVRRAVSLLSFTKLRKTGGFCALDGAAGPSQMMLHTLLLAHIPK